MESEEEETGSQKMRGGRVRRQGRYFDAMRRGTSTQQRQLLKYATPDQVDAMSEITYNFLQGRLPLPRAQLKTLASQKNLWRKIGDPRRSQTERRKWIKKGGGQNMNFLLRGLKQGISRGVKQGARRVQHNYRQRSRTPQSRPPPPPPESTRQDRIQELERDIQRMESTLKTI